MASSGGGVVLDGVLGDIVVVILDIVVRCSWALVQSAISFEICVVALSSIVAVGFCLCGVGTLCRLHSRWYSPWARMAEREESPAPPSHAKRE